MRTLTLTRREMRMDGIFSELTDEKGKILAHTLEHAYLVFDANGIARPSSATFEPKLYDGTFKCVRGIHHLHSGQIETFEVTGVRGHSGILFHVGNWNKDSDGCILLGGGIAQSPQGQMITGSKQMFADFMKLNTGVNEFNLVVRST